MEENLHVSDEYPVVETKPSPGLKKAVDTLREQLLDISNRNRLINTPVGKTRSKQLEIVDELSDEVFRILYVQGKKMAFHPLPPPTDSVAEDDQLADSVDGLENVPVLQRNVDPAGLENAEVERVFVPIEDADGSTIAARHIDSKLQTMLAAEPLQKRLLSLFRDARSLEEEQGVSVLFLGMGFLRWYESASSEIERFAPLILLPVDLQRNSARGKFRIQFRDQDMDPNLSLRAKLESDFGIGLPNFLDGSDWLPSEYFDSVRAAVSSQPRWRVEADRMVLGFYSFAKFLMWRDLSTENEWGGGMGVLENPLIQNLLAGGFESSGNIFTSGENLDERFPDPRDMMQILDADASQTQIIAAAREGKNLVVQGPPGTGKSQTIANIIAAAVIDDKSVLFVAEKRVALDVVHDRLKQCGLDALCLELHSHKANKKHVYLELKRTLDLGEPHAVHAERYEHVRRLRDELNRISSLLHRVDDVSGETPFGVIGRIAEFYESDCRQQEFKISGADIWDRSGFEVRLKAVEALAALTDEHGSERTHIWRGVRKRLNQMEQRRLSDRLRNAGESLHVLCKTLETASSVAGVPDAHRISAIPTVVSQLEAFDAMPDPVPDMLDTDVVAEQPEAVLKMCENVAAVQDIKASLQGDVIDDAFEQEWREERSVIAAYGRSLFRPFRGRYREAVARLRSVHRTQLPGSRKDRLALLDRLLAFHKKRRMVTREASLGRDAFGSRWRDEDTDMASRLPAVRWIASQADRWGSGEAVQRRIADLPSDADCARLAEALRIAHTEWLAVWQDITDMLELNVEVAFDGASAESVHLEEWHVRLKAWETGMESLQGWYRVRTAAQQVSELGLEELRARLADERLACSHAVGLFRFLRAKALWGRMSREEPELQTLDGAERTRKVEEFRTYDGQLQQLAAQEIALKHFGSLPSGSMGQVGIVRGEANKKTRHIRLRRLLDKAGEAVLRIKPVFLMSPLSVAQFLRPGGLTFDLLLIDEASQVRPADALGAIQRARQIVVVGDQKQLPPTSFFDRQVATGDDEGSGEDEIPDIQAGQVGDMESILSLCDSRSMHSGMLQWHYRSRHPSLIEVSNREFYDSKLVCPPSPDKASGKSGLTFVKIDDGIYDRGGKRNNPKEAAEVARQVLTHALEQPDKTLGVVAFSVAQRDKIRNELEFMRAHNPELDAFCEEGKEEAFFVKNLENVQGDERDVIFISVGYGKDANGYMFQNFGPVSREGGERRLNVLFTRARIQCCVFSSIDYRDIDIRPDATKYIGPKVLKRYLKFAETGELDIPFVTGKEADSPFEEAVAQALHGYGYRVAMQVGSAGFRIDLAVYDPDDAGRFLLAIECDGACYHSSIWARERDRLRQAVLEQKGWTVHRIWSTDWFYNRDAELSKVLAAIEQARTGSVRQPRMASKIVVSRQEPVFNLEPECIEYKEADFEIVERSYMELHEISSEKLVQYLVRVVEIEGPVHIQEAGRRLSYLWGNQRTGQRIQACVRNAVDGAERIKLLRLTDDFLDCYDSPEHVAVRDRSNVRSSSLRKPDMLPPSEIRWAILQAVERNISLNDSACAIEVARMFGYKSTRADLRERVEAQAEELIASGRLERSGNGELRLGAPEAAQVLS